MTFVHIPLYKLLCVVMFKREESLVIDVCLKVIVIASKNGACSLGVYGDDNDKESFQLPKEDFRHILSRIEDNNILTSLW